MPKTVLFLTPVADLLNVSRGTPIRIAAFLRVLREAGFAVEAYSLEGKRAGTWLRELRAKRPAIVLANTHRGIWPALFVKLVSGAKAAVDLHGAYEEERFLAGTIGPWRRRFEGLVCKRLLRGFDAISVVCGPFRDEYLPAGLRARTSVVRAGFFAEEAPSRSVPPPAPPLRFAYVGNGRGYQGLDTVLRIAKRLASEGRDFRLLIVSSERGSTEDAIRRELGDAPPSWLQARYGLPHAAALAALDEAHVLLLLRPDNPVTRFSFAAKIPEYLASGRTCVFSTVSDIASVLGDGRDAYLVYPDRTEEEGFALLRDLVDGKKPLLSGEAVRASAFRTFRWETACGEFVERLGVL